MSEVANEYDLGCDCGKRTCTSIFRFRTLVGYESYWCGFCGTITHVKADKVPLEKSMVWKPKNLKADEN